MDFAHARFYLLTHLLRNISITISTGVKESNDAGTSARTMNAYDWCPPDGRASNPLAEQVVGYLAMTTIQVVNFRRN
jgi:hypothetical protein